MNRHIKKVNSIFFYQKKYTDKVIKNINDIKNTSFIAIYNPETKGIMNATIELFGKTLGVYGICAVIGGLLAIFLSYFLIKGKDYQISGELV